MSSLSFFFKRMAPLLFLLGFWLLGLLFLYPLWLFSRTFPKTLLILFGVLALTLFLIGSFRWMKGQSVRSLIRQCLNLFKLLLGLFCLLVALVAFSYGLWGQGLVAFFLSLGCFYVKIPLQDLS